MRPCGCVRSFLDLTSTTHKGGRIMKSKLIISVVLCLSACSSIESEPVSVASLAEAIVGDALVGLTPSEQQLFLEGKGAFVEVENIGDGLGPLFNERACGRCHDNTAVGGAG